MARRRSPARLVIALSVAAVLAVFLLYSSIAGGGTPALRPSSHAGHTGKVSVSGRVLKPVTGDAHGQLCVEHGYRVPERRSQQALSAAQPQNQPVEP